MALNIKDQVKCEQLQNQITYNYYPVKLHRNLISSFRVIDNFLIQKCKKQLLRYKVKVKCHQNLIAHNTKSNQVTSISARQVFNYCAGKRTDRHTHGQTGPKTLSCFAASLARRVIIICLIGFYVKWVIFTKIIKSVYGSTFCNTHALSCHTPPNLLFNFNPSDSEQNVLESS